jgi:hypothetical protein
MKEMNMNTEIPKNNERRGRKVLDWLFSDWLWEVCLILIVTPVVVDQFLSLGTSVGA